MLRRYPWLIHGMTLREAGIDVRKETSEVRTALDNRHAMIMASQGIRWSDMRFGEQVHENGVLVAEKLSGRIAASDTMSVEPYAGVDGLVTIHPNVPLGIHVADCCAVFLVAPEARVIGLLHSGKKGTKANIVREGVRQLRTLGGGRSVNLVAALSPCIHACCYEVDFVGEIEQQLRREGVAEVWRHPDCTACKMDQYYSYRRERGRTGRMLAFMMIRGDESLRGAFA